MTQRMRQPNTVNGWLSKCGYCDSSSAFEGCFQSMWTKHHKKRRFGRLVVPAITVAFLSYFGYHSIHGDFGLEAMERLERQRIARTAERDKIVKTRVALERQVELMSDGSLERDMIDEISRYQLNMSKPDEIVIMNGYM